MFELHGGSVLWGQALKLQKSPWYPVCSLLPVVDPDVKFQLCHSHNCLPAARFPNVMVTDSHPSESVQPKQTLPPISLGHGVLSQEKRN